MSEYTVIDDITNTLLTLIRTNTDGLMPSDRVSATSPADVADDAPPRLALFLYQIGENRHLKNQAMQQTDTGQARFPPLSLDLYYLMTAYAQSRDTEQQILGRAMQILHDNSVIQGSFLQGSLSGTREEIIVALNHISLDDMNRLWSMFGNKPYRLSIPYRVYTALIDSTRERSGDRVIERTLTYSVS